MAGAAGRASGGPSAVAPSHVRVAGGVGIGGERFSGGAFRSGGMRDERGPVAGLY